MEKEIDTNALLNEIKKLNDKLSNVNNNKTSVSDKKRKKGTITYNNNGTARLQYMLNGERYSDTVEIEDEEDAEYKLKLFIEEIEKGKFVNTNLRYDEFMQIWFEKYVKEDCSISVIRSYKSYINNRILPNIGHIKLKNITTTILRDFFNNMKKWKTEYKPPRENEPIAKETYRKIYNIIHSSLKYAFEQELINSNPCDRISISSLHLERLPSELKKLENKDNLKKKTYNLKTYKKVLKLLDNHNENIDLTDKNRIKMITYEIILKTGFSLEELAGLKWKRDYNYKESFLQLNKVQVYVNGQGWFEKEPKASSRRRIIHIDKKLNELLKRLYDKFNQNEYILFDLINLSTYTVWLKRFQKNHKISPILTAHELRHTHLTIALYLTDKIKAVSTRAGHSNISMTLDTYVEPLVEDDIRISKIMNKF